MVHPSQQKQPFSRRKPLPTIIFARNGRVRSFKLRLWVAVPVFGLLGISLAAYIGASLYLIYRDDLLGATLARQVAMQHSYEDRIAALRAELDRVTSRHLVETESVEEQLGLLIERQATIAERQSALDGLVEQARATGITVAADMVRTPRTRPDTEQASAPLEPAPSPLAYAPTAEAADDIITGTLFRGAVADEPDRETRLRQILRDVQSSLDAVQTHQTDTLDALSDATESEAERLSTAVAPLGLSIEQAEQNDPQGGPYIPAAGLHFVERTVLVSRSLEEIAALRRAAEAMPVRVPVDASRISSRFGNRMDPFLGRPAFHSGLDLVAGAGTAVRATAPGTVVSAGWQGGYGLMVEIRHANGVSTRYGHLSKALVLEGDSVSAGDTVGLVGSTGRTTGAHLHYETRRDGDAVDPAIFLAAGRAL